MIVSHLLLILDKNIKILYLYVWSLKCGERLKGSRGPNTFARHCIPGLKSNGICLHIIKDALLRYLQCGNITVLHTLFSLTKIWILISVLIFYCYRVKPVQTVHSLSVWMNSYLIIMVLLEKKPWWIWTRRTGRIQEFIIFLLDINKLNWAA